MARYKLKPHLDKNGKYRISIPPQLSPSGKRQRLWFDSHSLALGAANRLRLQHDQFGYSLRMLPPARLTEATEVWAMLDKAAASGNAPSGSLRSLVLRELKTQAERRKSISLNGLFDAYLEKLKRNARSEHYIKDFKWCRNYFRKFLDAKVSDLKPADIVDAFAELTSGQRNAQLRLIRAVLNYGVKLGYLKSKPAHNLEFVYRPKVEVRPLSNHLVRGMLNDAATSERLEMLPYLALAFGAGCREAELFKLLWSDVVLAEKKLLIRASVSKTRNSRYVAILDCFPDWLHFYLDRVKNKPMPDERVMRAYTPSKLRDARAANWKAAGGIGKEPPNSKRRTCASCHRAFYEDDVKLTLQLGHTTIAMSREYAGAATKQQAVEYFNIRPEATIGTAI